MYCPDCGHKVVSAGLVYCPKCSAKLSTRVPGELRHVAWGGTGAKTRYF